MSLLQDVPPCTCSRHVSPPPLHSTHRSWDSIGIQLGESTWIMSMLSTGRSVKSYMHRSVTRNVQSIHLWLTTEGLGGGGEGSGRDRGEEREANSLHWRLGMSFSAIHRHNKKENQNPQPAPSVASTNADYQKSHQTCMLTLQTL